MAPPSSVPPDGFDRRDQLWRTLVRFDVYVGTTITRAALVTTLNGVAVAGVIANVGDVLALHDSRCLRAALLLIVAMIVATALASLAMSFSALLPYLGQVTNQKSLVFFGDVARRPREEFVERFRSATSGDVEEDLASQVHDLASGLSIKFARLRWAALISLYGLIPLIAMFSIVALVAALAGR